MSGCISPMNINSPLYICKIHLYLYIKKRLSYIIYTCGIKQILKSEAWGSGVGVGISISSVHFSHTQLFVTPWTAPHQGSLSINQFRSWLKFMSIKSVMPSNLLILCRPLLLLPSILPSIRVFANASALGIRWPKYWSFSFRISPSNEYSGLIFFRIDCDPEL